MADSLSSNGAGPGGLFAAPKKQPREIPVVPLSIAGGVVLLAIALLLFFGRGHNRVADKVLPPDPYAASLVVTYPAQTPMSESTSLSGGKSTYIDGHIVNNGPRAVTAITAQVLFKNDMDMPPQILPVPVMLIRSREPYIDTQTIAAAPIAPGASADFRLTFENIVSNWNMQQPEVRLIQVTTK